MNDHKSDDSTSTKPAAPADYEAPKVEAVVSPKDLEREVQYAGVPSQIRG